MNPHRRVLSALSALQIRPGDYAPAGLCAVTAALLLAGCSPPPSAEAPPRVEPTPPEHEGARKVLAEAEQSLVAKDKDLAAASTALKSADVQLAEKDQVIEQRDKQIKALQAELEGLKKRDTFVFGETRAIQRRGGPLVALDRYRQFVRDYPSSPLVADAESAITELTAESQRDTDRVADLFEPARRERQTLELLRDGLLTPAEMAPLFRRKSRAQVLNLLGTPNINFPDGTEIGYNDRAINPTTGKRGMLIVTFDSGEVTALRVDYAGRRLTP